MIQESTQAAAVPAWTSAPARIVALHVVVAVMLCSGALELLSYAYLRIADGYDGLHLMNYQFDDYKNIQPTPGYRNTKGIIHNAQGFRRHQDTTKEKPDGAYRIFIMGGSTAYGLGSLSIYGQQKYSVITNNETIDSYLEESLNKRVRRTSVEVINAAITSHFSHHHLIYLNQTVLKYHPDMVIFIDGFNDYYPTEKGFDQFRDYPYRKWSHLFMDEPTVTAWASYTGWWLFRKSHFIYLAGKTLRPFWLRASQAVQRKQGIDVEEALSNLSSNAQNNFVKIIERNALILRHEGVVPVFTLQPEIALEEKKTFTSMEKRIMAELQDHWPTNFLTFKKNARPIVIDAMEQATQKTDALFFDLTDIFGDIHGDVFTDHAHLSPEGNKRVAEYLAERLAPLINAGGRMAGDSHGARKA